MDTNEKSPLAEAFLWWCLPESNWGHMDFQSIALPAELRHHAGSAALLLVASVAGGKYSIQSNP